MSSVGQVESGTLDWVRAEIDHALDHARAAMGAYASDPGDETALKMCGGHLHQVAGTLQMVELEGAAMLAKEAELLVDAIIQGGVQVDVERCAALIDSSLVDLSGYLDGLQRGAADSPIHHVAVMNRLRQSRGVPPVEAASVFSPDLECYPPVLPNREKLDDDQYRKQAVRIRREFQVALLKWLKDGQPSALHDIEALAFELQGMTRYNSVAQFWWVARAHLEMLQQDPPAPDSARRRVPARLDQLLRKLIDEGEASIIKERREDLIREMLYDIGCSLISTPMVQEIKRAFNLDRLLRNDDGEGGEEDPVEIPFDLKSELKERVIAAKRGVTRYFDDGRRDSRDLAGAAEELSAVAERLRREGFADLGGLVERTAGVLTLVNDPESNLDSHSAGLRVAEILLFVEHAMNRHSVLNAARVRSLNDSLQRLKHAHGDGPGIDGEPGDIAAADDGELLSAVAGEMVVDLEAAELALEEFSKQPGDKTKLALVSGHLDQVQGALRMLGQHKAADMLSSASAYLNRLVGDEIEPTPPLIDALAVAVGTAQAFIDGLEKDRPYVHELVDRAIQDLEDVLTEQELGDFDPTATVEALREHLDSWLRDNANYNDFRKLRQRLREISAVASIRDQPKPRRIAQEMNNLLDIVTEDPSFLSSEIEQTLRRSLAALEELIGEAGVFEVADNGTPAADETEIEPEILEIFREEAQECTTNIDRLLAAWRTEPSDESVLRGLRRQFHTLKGSGRTANAGPIAELGWIVEDLLNRVLDGVLLVSPPLFSLVDDAQRTISALANEASMGADTLDLAAWQARADAFVEAKTDTAEPQAGTDDPVAPLGSLLVDEEASIAPDIPPVQEIDDTVVRIFTQETLGHIRTIRSFLGAQSTRGSPELSRAVHTLRGTSRSLHLVEMSDLFHALDERLEAVHSSERELASDELRALDKAAILSAKVLDRLNTDRTFPETLRREFETLRADLVNSPRTGRAAGRPHTPDRSTQQDRRGPVPTEGRVDEASSGLRTVFLDEATDLLNRINDSLDEWRDGGEQSVVSAEIRRSLHTLKGSAHAAGYSGIGELGHETEALLESVESGVGPVTTELRTLLEEAHDTLSSMIGRIAAGEDAGSDTDLSRRIRELAKSAAPPPDGPIGDARPAAPHEPANRALPQSIPATEHPVPDAGADEDPVQLRVATSVLDKLVNYAGEVSVTRAQLQQQLSGLKSNLSELKGSVVRFGEQLRQLDMEAESRIRSRVVEPENADGERDFDPLQMDRYTKLQQLCRSMSESLDDLVTIQSGFDEFVEQSESVLRRQAQLSGELNDGLMSTRLVPFSSLTPQLRHQVRQTARGLGKEAELRIVGGDLEMDRKVLHGVSEALEHMIRNALDHGIEEPSRRSALGKPACGSIRIECSQRGNEAVIRFTDDGAGLDAGRIRSRALDMGLIQDRQALTDQDIIQLIVLPGFTTSEEVTQLSGRGVGMDVVHNAVSKLGGSLSVEGETGKGTTFTLRVPLSLSITQALLVRCGGQDFAIALNAVQSVMKVDSASLVPSAGGRRAVLEHDGKVYPLIDLPKRLDAVVSNGDDRRVPVLIVRIGAREVAVKVDAFLATQEVVVKSLGAHLARLDGLAGATVRGDGSVVLILDLPQLWLSEEYDGAIDQEDETGAHRPPVIMVVDDSLTVRKVTARNLSRHGMEVMMARDGLDALQQMNTRLPDLMLVDIEMPRMDGYELTRKVREDAATRDIPIVIITSRAGSRHQEKAMALGANGYLTKPYQEDQLIANVESCLPRTHLRTGQIRA